MADDRPARPARPVRRTTRGEVRRVERLTPHMIRVVLGGEGLAGFERGRVHRPLRQAAVPAAGRGLPGAVRHGGDPARPAARAVARHPDLHRARAGTPRRRELTLDFVFHGDEGLAGPWAARARPGDDDPLPRPRRRLRPRPGRRLAPARRGRERAARDRRRAGARCPPARRPGPSSRWRARRRSRSSTPPATPRSSGCTAAARRSARRWSRRSGRWSSPPGAVHAFVHGEAGFVKELRRHLRVDAACRASGCRSPATGASAPTTTAGGPPSASGTPHVEAEEAAALSS